MRTPLVLLAGSLLVGCTVGESGSEGGDDVGGALCGDGVREGSEACDDGNSASGDGCSTTCSVEAVPRVELTADTASVATDLYQDNTVTLTVTGRDGFSGPVNLTVAAAASGTAITDWSTVLASTTLTVADGASQTVTLRVNVPGDTTTLSGEVKVTATSAVAMQTATVTVAANPQATITYTTNGNNCVYPTQFNIANPVRLKVGRQLRVLNASQTLAMQIHFQDGIAGIGHQDAPMAAGQAYVQTPTAPSGGANVTFYCHNTTQANVAADPPNSGTLRQRLIVVD